MCPLSLRPALRRAPPELKIRLKCGDHEWDLHRVLNDFPLDDLAPKAQTLLQLTPSLAEIAPAVELFGQVEVPDGHDSRRVIAVDN
jgi:hypothetical protein